MGADRWVLNIARCFVRLKPRQNAWPMIGRTRKTVAPTLPAPSFLWRAAPTHTNNMSLADVKWIDLPHVRDERGVLTAIEAGRDVPFEIRRVFFLHSVSGARGGHAHRATRQLLVPVAGAFRVEVADGHGSATYDMTDPHRGLYVPALTWIRLDHFSRDAVCLVLSDTHFGDAEYIRDWQAFVDESRAPRVAS